MTGAALAVKLRAYAHYTRSHEWERRATSGAAQSYDEAGLMAHTTTANRLARAATTRANLAHDAA